MDDLKPIDLAVFWSRVEVSEPFQCWPWKGRMNDKGYGRFRRTMAHRVAHELINGPIPDGQIVRHRCDNPACCNPHHLEVGTHADNSADAVERGRIASGAKNGRTRLTVEQADYIRRNPDGLKQMELARMFSVSAATVSYIRSGRSWKVVGAVGFEPTTACVSSKCSSPELSAHQVQMDLNGFPEPLSEEAFSKGRSLRCQRSALD